LYKSNDELLHHRWPGVFHLVRLPKARERPGLGIIGNVDRPAGPGSAWSFLLKLGGNCNIWVAYCKVTDFKQ